MTCLLAGLREVPVGLLYHMLCSMCYLWTVSKSVWNSSCFPSRHLLLKIFFLTNQQRWLVACSCECSCCSVTAYQGTFLQFSFVILLWNMSSSFHTYSDSLMIFYSSTELKLGFDKWKFSFDQLVLWPVLFGLMLERETYVLREEWQDMLHCRDWLKLW